MAFLRRVTSPAWQAWVMSAVESRCGGAAEQHQDDLVGDYHSLDRVLPAFTRYEPIAPDSVRCGAAHPDLGHVDNGVVPVAAEVVDHLSKGPQPPAVLDPTATFGQQ